MSDILCIESSILRFIYMVKSSLKIAFRMIINYILVYPKSRDLHVGAAHPGVRDSSFEKEPIKKSPQTERALSFFVISQALTSIKLPRTSLILAIILRTDSGGICFITLPLSLSTIEILTTFASLCISNRRSLWNNSIN